jgi:hypothetical protein
MNVRLVVVAAVAVVSLAGCASQQDASGPAGTWVGTITTEGDVTTVTNESGSVWGGSASLVEEASIGAAEGSDAEMLGLVRSVAMTDRRIYVLDASVGVVRAYSVGGEYVGDISRPGEGPGEYRQPMELGVADDGRLFIHDAAERRLSMFSADGAFLRSYFLPFRRDVGFVATLNGDTFGPVIVDPEQPYERLATGMLAYGPEGATGEPIVPPRYDVEIPRVAGARSIAVPHAPDYVWAMDFERNMVAGVSGTYAFEIARLDGSRVVVRSYQKQVPISVEERNDLIEQTTAFIRMRNGNATWTGPEVARVKPAFVRFLPTRSGETWVVRPGPSSKIERPDGSVRWRDTYTIDAFDRDGRFLGAVEMPAEVQSWIRYYATGEVARFAFVRGDAVVMPFEDDAGTIMVKRYRLVLPGDA